MSFLGNQYVTIEFFVIIVRWVVLSLAKLNSPAKQKSLKKQLTFFSLFEQFLKVKTRTTHRKDGQINSKWSPSHFYT